ncbi:putative phosphoesterase [Roseateles sp. YR242]|uniref:ligase-associated DNA damage response endonuclease PdeM n=1 Tax=Roseateles sp. YR242 TaxID=1855305 RepID=UPI0008D3263E|nr:ligase-associated DNA damage response endonuclease PdeM [Roseateles sp. YR242]SEL66416.1 putative phosphoesterase [Roseateles sp. YR242]
MVVDPRSLPSVPPDPLPGALRLVLGDEVLDLLPGLAAWWPGQRTLFVADVHLGKGASFRALGQPVPAGTTQDNLARLTHWVRQCGAERLVVLGDFLHAATAQQAQVLDQVHAWRLTLPELVCVLVRGNHDSHAGDPPATLRFDIVDEPHRMGPFLACHHPGHRPTSGTWVLAGHLHPAVVLRGPAHDRQRLPCFCLTEGQLILPAFGAFTGTTLSGLPAGAACYAVGGGRVMGPV